MRVRPSGMVFAPVWVFGYPLSPPKACRLYGGGWLGAANGWPVVWSTLFIVKDKSSLFPFGIIFSNWTHTSMPLCNHPSSCGSETNSLLILDL